MQIRKGLQILLLTLVWHDPRVRRHVRNGVLLACDKSAAFQATVKHPVQTVGLFNIAVNGVLNLLGRINAEMMILSGHGAQSAHLRSEEHTSELQSRENLVSRPLLE